MKKMAYSLVIATFERPSALAETLESITAQTCLPELIIIVDASKDDESLKIVQSFEARLPVKYERAIEASAAGQRNQGARNITTPLVGFLDDDTTLSRDIFEKICSVFEPDDAENIGGVAGRIEGLQQKQPHGLLWYYYRLQAGYPHPTYGGKLFGPAINCLPAYTETTGDLIPADWLNSTCVVYRTPVFMREMFPNFQGYSFMEDVHLSSRIAKSHKLFFHASALFQHHDAPSEFKRNPEQMARMRIRNQRVVTKDVLQLSGRVFEIKFFLHRLFSTVALLRRRDKNSWKEIIGTWS